MKIVKDILASVTLCVLTAAVILSAFLLFTLYIAGALRWGNIPTAIAAKKYLKETYSEPMKVISCRQNDVGSYDVFAKTINEPIIEFYVSVNRDRTEFADSYYSESALYYLSSDLKDGLNPCMKIIVLPVYLPGIKLFLMTAQLNRKSLSIMLMN